MTKEKLAERIKQLIGVTQQLLFYSLKLKELHDKHVPTNPIKSDQYKKSEIPMMLRFLHCTLYFDALLNLNTLLSPFQKDPTKKQQSIFELIDTEIDINRKNDLFKKANELRKKLKDKNLDKFRHKLVGHKDIENAIDTEIMYLNFIKAEYIEHSIKIVNEINDFVTNNYGVIINNLFAGLYDKSFEKMIELFENELRNQFLVKKSIV